MGVSHEGGGFLGAEGGRRAAVERCDWPQGPETGEGGGLTPGGQCGPESGQSRAPQGG